MDNRWFGLGDRGRYALKFMNTEAATITRRRRAELADIAPTRSNWTRITEWHARTRPLITKHYSSDLDAFDRILEVNWVAFPRVISPGGRMIDNSRTDQLEDAGNEQVVRDAHAKLLAHMDAIIELQGTDNESPAETQESDGIFAHIDQLIANSLLPEQYKSVVCSDISDAQKSLSLIHISEPTRPY